MVGVSGDGSESEPSPCFNKIKFRFAFFKKSGKMICG